jgi:hypothetical protein
VTAILTFDRNHKINYFAETELAPEASLFSDLGFPA